MYVMYIYTGIVGLDVLCIICVHTHMYIYIYAYMCIYIYMYVHIHMYIHVYTCKYIRHQNILQHVLYYGHVINQHAYSIFVSKQKHELGHHRGFWQWVQQTIQILTPGILPKSRKTEIFNDKLLFHWVGVWEHMQQIDANS